MSDRELTGYIEYYAHPLLFGRVDTVGTALHSLCVTKGMEWAQAYERLADVSGELGLMPADKRTVKRLFEENGFFLQAGSVLRCSVTEIVEECNDMFSDGEVLIVNVSSSRVGGTYIPIVPVEENGAVRYAAKYPRDIMSRCSTEVWIAWKDGADHSIKARRRRAAQSKTRVNFTKGNDSLVVYNENPEDNLIGDCAVRAIAGCLQIPWAEAVRKLVQAQDYKETVINSHRNIKVLLEKEGFQEFGPIVRNGKTLNGKQFCALINDMFEEGTRLVALSGRTHMVAILVYSSEYKIVDTWDSTDRPIIGYWAKYPEKKARRRPARTATEEKSEKLESVEVGTIIKHSTFGIGEIKKITGGFATIAFEDGSEKTLMSQWIIANCKKP